MNIFKCITLDVNEGTSRQVVSCRQNDNGKRLIISLNQSGRPYFVDADVRAVVAGTRADDFTFFNEATVEDGRVFYELTEQNTGAVGTARAELRLYKGEHLIASPAFVIEVTASAMDDGEVIEGAEATALTQLISEADEAIDRMQATAITAAEISVDNSVGEPAATVELIPGEDGQTIRFALSNVKGNKGDKGAAGPVGPRGETGPVGPQGTQGEVGPVGPQGERGIQGERGLQGVQGATGPKGDPGPQGPIGETGPAGPAGPQGPKGDPGEGVADLLNAEGIIKQQYFPEGYPYSEIGEGIVLPETTVTPNENGEATLTDALGLVEGQTYTVNWNGTDYECVCVKAEMDGDGDGVADMTLGVALGNVGVMTGGEDTGEPFVIVEPLPEIAAQVGAAVMVLSATGSTSVTLSITGITEETEVIAQKFLPKGYPYSEVSEGYILPETSYAVDDSAGMAYIMGTPPALVIGQEYTVNWNGTEYTSVALDSSDMGEEGGYVLGNIGAMTGGDNTGEPFVIIFLPAENEMVQAGIAGGIIPLDGTTSGIVSIYGITEVVTPIAQKFLPDIDKGIEIVELYGPLAADGTEHELSHARADIERAVDAGKIVILKYASYRSSSSVEFLHLSSMGSGSIVFTRQETAGQLVRFEEIVIGTSNTIDYRKGIINAEVTYSGLITNVTTGATEATE